jgi:phosphate transport system permease protein
LRIIEISFRNIPREQIENAYALGADDIKIASRVYLPQASKGILSGILLAVSIAAGETAQLIYTAGFNNALPTGFLKSQVAYLTYVVWTGINQPSQYSHYLAYVSAMILILTITALIFLSKYIVRRK